MKVSSISRGGSTGLCSRRKRRSKWAWIETGGGRSGSGAPGY